jgi:hypothetical protein
MLTKNKTHSLINSSLRYISGIIDRNSHENFKPKFDDANDIVSFGIAHPFHGVIPSTSHQNAIPHSLNVNPLIHNKLR